jgi:hypothetical protein
MKATEYTEHPVFDDIYHVSAETMTGEQLERFERGASPHDAKVNALARWESKGYWIENDL